MKSPRTSKPGSGNKYFITKSKGGYSTCIQGKPTDKNCNVLANCVGYACGAFNEEHEFGYEKYHLNCNAENFIERAIASGLSVYQKPMVGGIIVWQKGTLKSSDGAGHVAIVTYVNNVNDPTQIKTSESGYGAKSPFWQTTRNKGNGNWGQASSYKYRGCIAPVGYKPPEPPKPTPTPTRKFKEGDRVVLNGPIYLSSMSNIPSNTIKDKITTITRVVKGECKHPYNTTGDLGWCDESSLKLYNPTPTPPKPTEFKIGDNVILNGPIYYRANDIKAVNYIKNKKTKITRYVKGTKHPYNTTGDLGWCDAASLKKV